MTSRRDCSSEALVERRLGLGDLDLHGRLPLLLALDLLLQLLACEANATARLARLAATGEGLLH